MTDEEQLAELESQLGQAQKTLESLRSEIVDAKGGVNLTMRGQVRCPACGGREILHATKVLDRGESNMRYALALVKPSMWRGKTYGQFQVYICSACGLTEWYVDHPREVPVDGKTIRHFEGDEELAT